MRRSVAPESERALSASSLRTMTETDTALEPVVDEARAQTRYQVRFAFDSEHCPVLTGADVLVVADALPGTGPSEALAAFDGPVLEVTLGNADATADWILAQQHGKGDRFAVAVVAVGDDGAYCVEDQLLAGRAIDALADRGIDYASPEAAAAVAAAQGLSRAVSHILSASVAGQRIIAAQGREAIDAIRLSHDDTALRRIR